MDFATIEKYFEEGIQAFEKYVLPIASLAVATIPGVPPLVVTAMGGVTTLMKVWQQILPEDGQGPLRSAAILAGFKELCAEADKLLPAESKSLFDQIQPILQLAMTTGINMVNANNPTVITPVSTVDAPAPV